MLARVSLASANLDPMTPAERIQRVKSYVQGRLVEEVSKGPRGTQARLARALKITTAHVANLTTGNPPRSQPGDEVCRKAADYWGLSFVELERLATGEVDASPVKVARPSGTDNPTIGLFMMKLRRLPGLEQWIEENPTRLTVGELWKGMTIYDTVKPRSREDGEPLNGWGSFFDDALSGRLTGPAKKGDQAAAEALEYAQMSPGTRRLLGSPDGTAKRPVRRK